MEDDVTTKRIIHGVFGGIIVLCISVIALLLIYGKQANYQIYLQAKAISLHGSIGDTIPYQDIMIKHPRRCINKVLVWKRKSLFVQMRNWRIEK